MECKHDDVQVRSKAVNHGDNQWTLEVEAHCTQCMRPFLFKGQKGYSADEPRTNIDGSELRIPMELLK